MKKALKIGAVAFLVVGLTGLVPAHETPDILHAGDGRITWTNINPSLYYSLEWCSSITTGEWQNVYDSFRDVQSADDTISLALPAFFRVRAYERPEYIRYLTATSHWMEAGYYPATNLALADPNLTADNIPYGVTIFGVEGSGTPKSGMALIQAGDFIKTDYPDGSSWATNYISAFYISRTAITKAHWDTVRSWASTNGYTDLPVGGGKGADHPVHTVSWYDVVKWCNARSEMEGLTPVYTTDDSQTTVYRTGVIDLSNACVNWTVRGYRLPTASEWEKAARGGLHAHRFPWGHTTNMISHDQANFANGDVEAYQYGTTGYHPDYNDGTMPYTSPVGSFAPNGYGLYDMTGNVWEWCWDRHAAGGYYVAGTDPRGPDTGLHRVIRGGGWYDYATYCRSAFRSNRYPYLALNDRGFRVALPVQ